MDSDEGEGESINEGLWMGRGSFIHSKIGERLSTSPHYHLLERSPAGEIEKVAKG